VLDLAIIIFQLRIRTQGRLICPPKIAIGDFRGSDFKITLSRAKSNLEKSILKIREDSFLSGIEVKLGVTIIYLEAWRVWTINT